MPELQPQPLHPKQPRVIVTRYYGRDYGNHAIVTGFCKERTISLGIGGAEHLLTVWEAVALADALLSMARLMGAKVAREYPETTE